MRNRKKKFLKKSNDYLFEINKVGSIWDFESSLYFGRTGLYAYQNRYICHRLTLATGQVRTYKTTPEEWTFGHICHPKQFKIINTIPFENLFPMKSSFLAVSSYDDTKEGQFNHVFRFYAIVFEKRESAGEVETSPAPERMKIVEL